MAKRVTDTSDLVPVTGGTAGYKGTMMKAGIKGEDFLIEILGKDKYITLVEDLRGDPDFRRDDIDFRLHLSNGKIRLVEVKTDRVITDQNGNFFFELTRCYFDEPDSSRAWYTGWSGRTKADYIVIYTPNYNHSVFRISFDHWIEVSQTFVQEKGKNAEKWVSVVKSDDEKYTFGLLIPIKYFLTDDEKKFKNLNKAE